MYDAVIIGSGPAGLSAALYAARAMLNFLVIEEMPLSGGQIINTHEVDNYIGIPNIGGFELAQKFRAHVDSYNAKFITDKVTGISNCGEYKEISLEQGETLQSRTVIIATGARYRKLGVSGEDKFTGRGVSYCATCDGALYRDKIVAVVGGGDTALEDAIFLSRICKKVYLIHRRNELRGAKILCDRLKSLDNAELIMNTTVEKIIGDKRVESVEVKNKLDGGINEIKADGVFIAVGMEPNSNLAKDIVQLGEGGYIITDEACRASADGIFAVGDVRAKDVRQVITAAADGAVAAASVEKYLLSVK